MAIDATQYSSEDWDIRLGEHVRSLRISRSLDQRELAELAGLSLGAVRNLETGRGSTTRTLIRVIRALDRTEWLDTLAPAISVSPIAVLRGTGNTPKRVRRPRGT